MHVEHIIYTWISRNNFVAIKNRSEDGHSWNLDLGLFRVIGISKSHVQASIVLPTCNSCTSNIQLSIVANVKIEPSDAIY